MLYLGTRQTFTLPESFLLIGSLQLSIPKRRKVTHFDVSTHSLDILPHGDRKKARLSARLLYDVDPDTSKTTLTVRNGRRALAQLLLDAEKLDDLPRTRDPANIEANGMVDDLIFTDELRSVFTDRTKAHVPRRGIVLADLSGLDDTDRRVLAAFLALRYQGTVVIPDFGFYALPFHVQLIRQGRLIAGLYTLSEVDQSLRQQLLLGTMEGHGCTYDDACVLADYAGHARGTDGYSTFVHFAMK